MMRKKQSMLTVLLLGVFLFGFAVWGILKPVKISLKAISFGMLKIINYLKK